MKAILLSLTVLLVVIPATSQMHDHADMAAGDGQFNPYVISDNRDGFYSVFIERTGGKSNVKFQHIGSAAVQVNRTPGDGAVRNENPPKIASGANGEIFIVWANERERWKGNIRFARSLNGGKSFEPAINVNSETTGPTRSASFALKPLRTSVSHLPVSPGVFSRCRR